MKKLLALEELAQLVACIYALSQLDISYNYLVLFFSFFVPDLFAVGYFINRTVGAFCYNFSHHKLVAIAMMFVGVALVNSFAIAGGLVAYAHGSFDRAIGYGLKYVDSPNHTHLGFIGKEKDKNQRDHF